MPKNAVERLMAHHGGVLSIDWKGATDATQILGDSSSEDSKAGSSYGWGWLATAGMDGTVKVSKRIATFPFGKILIVIVVPADMGHVLSITHTTGSPYSACRKSVTLRTLVSRPLETL